MIANKILAALAFSLVAITGMTACSGEQNMEMDGQGQTSQRSETSETGGSEMNHSSMDDEQMSMDSMLMENGEYSDRRFIDAMVPHHRGAVEMAEVALKNAGHEEIVALSEDIIRTQNAEIEELKDIKQSAFGTSDVPEQMSDAEMQMMGMSDPAELARQNPFDLAFIEEMIPHHESAVEMAEIALKNSDNPEIRSLAGEITSAQKREVSEMRQWKESWYPND